MSKQYDKVELFNILVHDKKNRLNKKIYDNIMNNFSLYKLLSSIVTKDMDITAEVKNDTVHFIIDTKTKKAYKKLSDLNNKRISDKHRLYKIKIREVEDQKIVDLHFRREDD